jgi:hypothetical protein
MALGCMDCSCTMGNDNLYLAIAIGVLIAAILGVALAYWAAQLG